MKTFYLFIIFVNLQVIYSNHHAVPLNFPSRFLRQTKSGCVLPPHPQFGQWTVINSTSQWLPQNTVPSGTVLEVFCDQNYNLDGLKFINCKDNSWLDHIGRCIKKCSPIYSTKHLTVTCLDKDGNNIDCTEGTENSSAEFTCQDFYEIKDLHKRLQTICINGTWNNEIPKCVPECGKNRFSDSALKFNAFVMRQEDFPWQVAIYNGTTKKELICSGSLLSERVVLTAAHCISDNDGTYYSKDTYIVAVGKYYRQYNDRRDFDTALFSPVHSMHYPQYYHGQSQNFYADLAIIITKRQFMLSERVRPVCIEGRPEIEKQYFTSSNYGYVAGWGFTNESGNFSDKMRVLEVPLVSYQKCITELPSRFKRFFTDDKLCAGYLNKGISVCKGDSGGGLILKNNNKYYILGLVSVGPSSPKFSMRQSSCDSQHYTLYTKISEYRRFIAEKIKLSEKLSTEEMQYISDEDKNLSPINNTILLGSSCVLPEHPEFGQWSVKDTHKNYLFVPGQVVDSGTGLMVNCKGRYVLNGSSYLICDGGSWSTTIGNCLKTCPSLSSTKTLNVECAYPGYPYSKNCVNAIDGTLAKFKCTDFYKNIYLNINPIHICVNGGWNHKTPTCSPECGRYDDSNGTIFFPWHVAIYSTNKDLLCSGSLISEKIILTAAHCVLDSMNNPKPKDAFLVAVGNRYRLFNDSQDSRYVQISEIKDIFIPDLIDSGDVAILVAKETFKFSTRVRPICLNKNPTHGENVELLYTSGYGYNIDKHEYPDTLKTVGVSKDSTSTCEEKFSPENSSFGLIKICARYVNNGSMICYGDTGAGLFYQHDDRRFYLGGVMSVSRTTPVSIGVCKRQEMGVYTQIKTQLIHFILLKTGISV